MSQLSSISSSKKNFFESMPIYQEAVIKSRFDEKLEYQKNTSTKTSKQQRKRKIIWTNPPFSIKVSTSVGCYLVNKLTKFS